ncbi:hypothetical protein AXF42_Ash009262 [Apostasia shenzhenica]|uniref:Uncharacterized protein n=1 Tax=Apostasia shenzhenica TaxID=1088818 RepID=A0A2I0B3K6_9ASPA|nr:hypothetical protein AXF42_Ash009262 [Apostasia shenzhenica]
MARAGRSAVFPCAARWKQERMERERKLDLGDNGMNDFTFCRVDLQADNDLLESPKVIPNVNKITLTDSSISDGNLEKTSDSSRGCSSDSLTERNGGWIDFPLNCSSDMIQPKNKPNKLEVREITRSTGDPLLVFEEKLSSRKPAVRAKVPFEKGYSQMDWLKLTGTHPDLAGKIKGRLQSMVYALSYPSKAEPSVFRDNPIEDSFLWMRSGSIKQKVLYGQF